MTQAQGECFNGAGDYTTCLAAGAAGRDRFSSWAVDFNRYSDVDANPYVIGSAAYNAAHGLPAPPSWNDRTTAAAEQRALLDAAAKQIVTASGTLMSDKPGNATSATSAAVPGLIPLALIALALLLLKR